MIKLIVCDMDGTLLDNQGQLNEQFWELETKLANKGIKFAIASGRQYYNLLDRFERIKDNLIFLADNGSYVIYRDEQVHIDSLDSVSAIKFIEIGRKIEEAYVIVSAKNSAYVENIDERFLNEARKYFKRLEIVEDLTKVQDTVLKVTICDFNNSETNSYLHYKQFEKEYKVAVAGKLWLDISDWGANKGTAVKKMQEKFGIAYEETMVFGDYLNDMEMMTTGKYSYAMKNAHPKIIEAASYLTKYTNNENGVLETIKELGLV
ncbi:HAD family hydrolase [Emticicia sp. BO119]|uniref:HAD family hydrolase n=1 Tax=Emticicia sp. BO119 TaxID=2757768 RepID=UPI0015F07E30|nr:HAD family hydrolase [Emticicia sp. BO119]MBA4849830.1 HAD family phosphatase [Emticicia sp. BO119]